jgi:uncharacterized membrane protein YdjX (TVP38/TMEM64 family)
MNPKTRLTLLRIGALILVVGLTIALFVYRDYVQKLEAFGYPGIFLVSILSNATLILPVPGVLSTTAMGAVFNPFWIAIAAGSGAALGEITGYLAGFSGQAVVENKIWYERLTRWLKRYGNITIFLLAVVPNPVFDIAGITAGMLRMPLWRYLLWSWLGKIVKMLGFAYGGAMILQWIPWW